MILHHKAKRVDTGDEVVGFIVEKEKQYIIINPEDTRCYIVDEDTIEPCFEELNNGLFWAKDIIFSDNLSEKESSMFLWLLKKAQNK